MAGGEGLAPLYFILLPFVKTIFLSIYFLFLFPIFIILYRYNLLYLFMHQEGVPPLEKNYAAI